MNLFRDIVVLPHLQKLVGHDDSTQQPKGPRVARASRDSLRCSACGGFRDLVAFCPITKEPHMGVGGGASSGASGKAKPPLRRSDIFGTPSEPQRTALIPSRAPAHANVRHTLSSKVISEMREDSLPTRTELAVQATGSVLQSMTIQGFLFCYLGCPTPFPSPFLVAGSAILTPILMEHVAPDSQEEVLREQEALLAIQQSSSRQ